jgi:hypothetical protein
MESSCFFINESPKAFWDWELKKRNLEFLKSINPDYYNFIVESSFKNASNGNEHNNAILIRQTYSQSLELLFSLLCSVVQAPNCTIGWMLCYTNSQLNDTIKKINDKDKIKSNLKINNISWDSISNLIFKYVDTEKEKQKLIISKFSSFWEQLARTYLNEKFNNEYNIIKHGIRFTPGGFDFKFNLGKDVEGKSNSVTFQGSKFGTTYFLKESIQRYNYKLISQSRNWDPNIISKHIQLITLSIKNIVAWLIAINEKKVEGLVYSLPGTENDFDKFTIKYDGVFDMSLKLEIKDEDINPYSKEQINELIKTKNV